MQIYNIAFPTFKAITESIKIQVISVPGDIGFTADMA